MHSLAVRAAEPSACTGASNSTRAARASSCARVRRVYWRHVVSSSSIDGPPPAGARFAVPAAARACRRYEGTGTPTVAHAAAKIAFSSRALFPLRDAAIVEFSGSAVSSMIFERAQSSTVRALLPQLGRAIPGGFGNRHSRCLVVCASSGARARHTRCFAGWRAKHGIVACGHAPRLACCGRCRMHGVRLCLRLSPEEVRMSL